MVLIKRKTRKKLSKQLAKLVKRHGPEKAIALVAGIVTSLAADTAETPHRTAKPRRRSAVRGRLARSSR